MKQETKLKIFKFVNKILFCKLLKLHLPIPFEQHLVCVICSNKVELNQEYAKRSK